MTKITMLGTGGGRALNLYNTCFTIQNESGVFLIDSGGGVEIFKRLKKAGIQLNELKNIFISHSHTDHILGLIWLFKTIGVMVRHNEIKENINIYCNDVVYEAIKGVAGFVLPEKLINAVYSKINFIILNNNDKHTINEIEYEFFDILARGTKQFGFECNLEENRFLFLGDENLDPALNSRVENADYVMHEALCLDSEENIFHAYEKNHSTVLSAAKKLNDLNVKNIILYHTEESHPDRKELYTREAKSVFEGNVLVPDDLEVIELIKKVK